jgi:hypothetical protein
VSSRGNSLCAPVYSDVGISAETGPDDHTVEHPPKV